MGSFFERRRDSNAKPVSKGNPVNIPEPEGWTGCYCLESSVASGSCPQGWVLRVIRGSRISSDIQEGGNAKPTFGTLAVTPGRDLFSS